MFYTCDVSSRLDFVDSLVEPLDASVFKLALMRKCILVLKLEDNQLNYPYRLS